MVLPRSDNEGPQRSCGTLDSEKSAIDNLYGENRAIPAILNIFVVFSLILILNRLRLQLSLSLLIGSLLLALLTKLEPGAFIRGTLAAISSLQTLSLVAIIGLLLIMSRLMEGSGHMKRLVDSFTRLSKDARVVGSVMPALIGLLPMPGGALFSAPMVETSLHERSVSGEQKTVLNYWFRHIWEYWWPLYPGVVLAIALLGVDTWRFITFMAPLTLLSAIAGVIFILLPLRGIETHRERHLTWSEIKGFLWEIMPILIVILVILLLAGLTRFLHLFDIHIKISGVTSILPGLVLAILWVCLVNRIPLRQFRAALLDKNIISLLLLIFSIMIFKTIMTESQAVSQVRDELMAYKIPVLLVIMILPFVSGIITGVAMGFVGASFPLIIPLFPAIQAFDYMALAALAYAFGYMGMMLSPVHLCLLVSKDYYKASLTKSYRHLLPPVIAVLIGVVVLFFGIKALTN
jgi:integral membrane protein (TIGR00529 family)